MERKNINRGFKKLRVWKDSIELCVLTCNVLKDFPFELIQLIKSLQNKLDKKEWDDSFI